MTARHVDADVFEREILHSQRPALLIFTRTGAALAVMGPWWTSWRIFQSHATS